MEKVKKKIQQSDLVPYISMNPNLLRKVDREIGTLFSEETRRKIYVAIAFNGPSTVAQLSRLLDIVPSAMHKHVKILVDTGALREVKLKVRGVERYYDINLPVLTQEDKLVIQQFLEPVAKEITKLLEKTLAQGDKILKKTSLAKRAFTIENPNIVHMFITQIYMSILQELEKGKRKIFGDKEWVMYGEIIHFPGQEGME